MSASGAFGPATPGIDLSKTKNGAIIRAVVSLMVIGTIAVMLHFVSQMMREKGKFLGRLLDPPSIASGTWYSSLLARQSSIRWWQASLGRVGRRLYDYLAGIDPSIFLTIYVAPVVSNALGELELLASFGQVFNSPGQILFSYVMIYAGAVSFTKASVVMYYWRLFRQRWSTYPGLFLTRYTTPGAKGHCIDVPLLFFANGIWAMLVDVCILIITIRPLLGLRMSTRKKIMVGGVLGLEGFVCIASIVRIISIHQLIHNDDLTWSMASVFIWLCCEPFIGILCACMPCYAPLLRHFWKSAGSQSRSAPTSGFPSGNINGSSMGKSGQGIPIKVKRDWDRIVNPTLGDDEVQLTTYPTGPGSTRTKGSDESGSKGITVKTDIRWESHAV
ncbi:hypothetical protein ABEF95_010695 [Exophiala dermatitidis]